MTPVKRPRMAGTPGTVGTVTPPPSDGGAGDIIVLRQNAAPVPSEAPRALASLDEIDPAQLEALKEIVRKVVPLDAIENTLSSVLEAVKAQQRDSDQSRRVLVEGVGKALNAIGGRIGEKIASENRAQAEKFEEQLRTAREEAKKDAARRAKKQFLWLVLALSVSSVLVISALMWFVRWNEMSNLRDRNSALSKENASLESKRSALVADIARSEQAITSKKNELGQLESRHTEILSQLQGTTEAFKAVQGARNETELQMKRLQQLAAQKLIPSGKPDEYFVEIDPATKSFVSQNGKTYIRVK